MRLAFFAANFEVGAGRFIALVDSEYNFLTDIFIQVRSQQKTNFKWAYLKKYATEEN